MKGEGDRLIVWRSVLRVWSGTLALYSVLPHNLAGTRLLLAPITVVPHPPRLVVGRDYEGDLTLAACPLGRAFALYGELLLYIAHLCSTDLLPL